MHIKGMGHGGQKRLIANSVPYCILVLSAKTKTAATSRQISWLDLKGDYDFYFSTLPVI